MANIRDNQNLILAALNRVHPGAGSTLRKHLRKVPTIGARKAILAATLAVVRKGK